MMLKCGMLTGLATLLFATAGCSTIDVNLPWEKSIPTASEKHPVREVMALWQPGEGRGLDQLPTRGFAGQILFFAAGIKTPVKVDGDVTIYVFDDVGTREEQKKPIHQFNFDAGSWNTYLTKTNFGPAYQIFIPYTRKGAHQANCALRIKLEPVSGSKMFSDVANVVLKGEKKPGEQNDGEQVAKAVQPAIQDNENGHMADRVKKSKPVENRFEKLNSILEEAKAPRKTNQLNRLEQLLESAESDNNPKSEESDNPQPRMLSNRSLSREQPHPLDSRSDTGHKSQRHPLDPDAF